VIGGDSAISKGVQTSYGADNRISGMDRYATSVAVAQRAAQITNTQPKECFIASGATPADALSASSVSAKEQIPILLTDKDTLPGVVATYLASTPSIKTIHILGGDSAISDSVKAAVSTADPKASISRLSGDTRYDTMVSIIDYAISAYAIAPTSVGIASGADNNYPDALSGGAAEAHAGGILLLTNGTTLSPQTQTLLSTLKGGIKTCDIYGGAASISQGVIGQVQEVLS
jgi:putative cell wall-binding protein